MLWVHKSIDWWSLWHHVGEVRSINFACYISLCQENGNDYVYSKSRKLVVLINHLLGYFTILYLHYFLQIL